MKSEQTINDNNNVFLDENGMPVQTQYVDEFGNPIDPSLIDENGNYIGEQVTQYVDEFGNPIDPSLIDENGNYIGEQVQYLDELGNPVATQNLSVQPQSLDENQIANALNIAANGGNELVSNTISASARQMDDKELMQGMVTFDYNNVPITDIVNSIILDAINKGASDIHFDPFDDGIKIRIRIDGQLNDYSIVPLFVKKNMITRVKIISGMNITESRTPQDGAIRTELADKSIDLRVSCLPTNMGEKIVIRIMDYSMSASGVEALDFSENNLKNINKMLALPNGIILVTGATGSGKSTTVYSMLQKLNVEGTNIVTVEDPIEMNIGGINQVQAISEIGLTFATVLRSILRQDPDVIMIGEIRDDETARIAVRASITGHLVLSTIHTNNSLNTIERLTDMSVERYLLGSALSGIVSQKLARRLCDKCRKKRPTTDYEKEIFKKVLDKDITEIYEPVGCPECSRGYRGRIAIQEVLVINQTIQDAITKGVPKEVLRDLVYGEHGTATMLADGLEKVLDAKTSFEEILKLIDLEDDLGTGTQLGLNDQMAAANVNNSYIPTGNQPININITPDLLAGLNLANLSANINDDDDEEVVIKPVSKKKKKKKKIVEIDPEDLLDIVNNKEIQETIEEIPEDEIIKIGSDPIEETVDEEIVGIEEEPIIEEHEIEILDDTEEQQPAIKDIENIEELEDINDVTTVEENNIETLENDSIQPIEEEIIDNFEELEEIEQLDIVETEKQEDELPTLFNKLIDTRKIIGKKKYNLKVKDILKDIKPLITTSTPIPDEITNYIKEIEASNNISTKVRKEIIEEINNTFNINENASEDDLFELIEEPENNNDETFDSLIKDIEDINEESFEDDIKIEITSNDLNENVEVIISDDTTTEIDEISVEDELDEEPFEKLNIEIIPEDLNSNIDVVLTETEDEEEATDETIDETLDDILEEETVTLTSSDLNTDIEINIKQDDDETDDIDDNISEDKELELELEDDFTAIDDAILNSLLDTLGDIEEEEE